MLFVLAILASGQTPSDKIRDASYPDRSVPFWPKYESVVKGAAMIVANEVPQCAKVENAQLFISDFDLTKRQDPERPITTPERSIISVFCWGHTQGGTWFVRGGKLLDEKESAHLRILGPRLVDRWLRNQ